VTDNTSSDNVLFGLSKTLFWDTDTRELNAEIHAQMIVERVLTRGTWDEFKRTILFYSKKKVKQLATQIRYLDEMVLEFCVTYFNLPKEKFKCYKHRLLNQSHWYY